MEKTRRALLYTRTDFTGEPGGVGYIENERARKFDDETILRIFKKEISGVCEGGVIYDHPYFVGMKELHLLEKMILIVKDMGFKIVSISFVPQYLEEKQL